MEGRAKSGETFVTLSSADQEPDLEGPSHEFDEDHSGAKFPTNTMVMVTKRSAFPFWSYSQNTRGDPAINMYFNNISANFAPFGVIWVSFGRKFYFGSDGSSMVMRGIVCGLLF